MNARIALSALAGVFLLGSVWSLGAAGEEPIDAATKAKIAQFDKGPSSVDVAAYPPAIQKAYGVFRQRCTLCHTLARPINSDFVLPDEWSRYVKRMMHKPGSNITPENAKTIYTFLVYDSSVRKKAMLEAALAKLTDADRAAAQAKIDELRAQFPHN